MNIKLITSTIEKAKIQGDTLDFVSAICISFSVKKIVVFVYSSVLHV